LGQNEHILNKSQLEVILEYWQIKAKIREYEYETEAMSIFSIYLFLAMVIFPFIPHEAPATSGSMWHVNYSMELGFKPDVEPEALEVVSAVTGQVIDPSKLSDIGLNFQKGDRIQVIGIGNDKWQIRHMKTGQSVTAWWDYSQRRFMGRPD
jgi:hypothetical protein